MDQCLSESQISIPKESACFEVRIKPPHFSLPMDSPVVKREADSSSPVQSVPSSRDLCSGRNFSIASSSSRFALSKKKELSCARGQEMSDLLPREAGAHSRSESSHSDPQSMNSRLHSMSLKRKLSIELWMKVIFFAKGFGALQLLLLVSDFTPLGRFLILIMNLLHASAGLLYLASWKFKLESLKFYYITMVTVVIFITNIMFSLEVELLSDQPDSLGNTLAKFIISARPLISIVLVQTITVALEYIEVEKQRFRYYIVITLCYIVSLINPKMSVGDIVGHYADHHIYSVLAIVVLSLLILLMSLLNFRVLNHSSIVSLLEKDEVNRLKSILNSVQDQIIVEHGGSIVFRNKAAFKAYRLASPSSKGGVAPAEGLPSAEAPVSVEEEEDSPSHLGISQFYVYQNFLNSSFENGERSSKESSESSVSKQCLSLTDILAMSAEEVSSTIFTTSKEISSASSLDQLQQIIERLQKEDDKGIPAFVQIKLNKVTKEFFEDLADDMQEVMIQISDVSQRILGQNLKIERQYMSIMNSTVSHEMRNPLNALLSSVEAQERYVNDLFSVVSESPCSSKGERPPAAETLSEIQRNLGVAKSSCKLLKFNVEDILALPQIQQGKFTKNVSHVNLHSSVLEIVEIMEFQLKQKGVSVDFRFSGFPLLRGQRTMDLDIDEQRFQQILLNFLSNAIKFTQRGRIRIALHLVQKKSRQEEVTGSDGEDLESSFYGIGINRESFLFKSFKQCPLDNDATREATGPTANNLPHASTPSVFEMGQQQKVKDMFRPNEHSDKIVLGVLDTGVGIKPEDQTQLFKLFGRVKSTEKINTKGVGLGLSISKMIAEEFGGEAALRSKPMRGSAFYASMLVNQQNQESPLGSVRQSRAQLELAQKLKSIRQVSLAGAARTLSSISETQEEPAIGKRILIVDDEAYNCEILAIIMKSLGVSEDRIDLRMGGEEALKAVKSRTTDGSCEYGLILTDLSMPFMDGYQLSGSLRELFFSLEVANVPILAAITGHTECEFFTSAFACSIDQVFSKPITSEQVALLLTEAGFKVQLKSSLRDRILKASSKRIDS